MPCYHPLLGYKSNKINPSGKRSIVFNGKDCYTDITVTIPCGNCLGCKLEKARQWAVRCNHEAQLHNENCFITLTYNNEHLPENGTLVKSDLQKFMKRLRKKGGQNIKFYASGEYGEKLSRPHYHVCIFGYSFPDKKLLRSKRQYKNFGHTIKGYNLYTSATLQQLWPFGFSTVGELNEQTAGYTARYILKKIFGKKQNDHYKNKTPEFSLMSRGGRKGKGLSYGWIETYYTDVYPKDCFTINGKKHKPPRYYDKFMEEKDVKLMNTIKNKRMKKAQEEFKKHGLRRLQEREHHKTKTTKLLIREYEGGKTDGY